MVPSVQLTKFRSTRVTGNWLERLSLRSRSASSPAGPGRICFLLPFKAAKWSFLHTFQALGLVCGPLAGCSLVPEPRAGGREAPEPQLG